MKVKNIKSFIEFYKSLGITTCISQSTRIQEKDTFDKKGSCQKIIHKKESNNSIIPKSERIKNLLVKVHNLDCNLKDIASNLVSTAVIALSVICSCLIPGIARSLMSTSAFVEIISSALA